MHFGEAMRLEEVFPRWQSTSVAVNVPWHEELDLTDDKSFDAILKFIVREQTLAGHRGADFLQAASEAIANDIIEVQNVRPDGCNPLNLEYLQFEASRGLGTLGAQPWRSSLGRS
jgi:hypothetical protein